MRLAFTTPSERRESPNVSDYIAPPVTFVPEPEELVYYVEGAPYITADGEEYGVETESESES